MNAKRWLPAAITTIALIQAVTTASGADAPTLVAPIYPGAVPAVLAEGTPAGAFHTATFGATTALDCGASGASQSIAGPWCFLSRDSIDKVKAYYEQSIGPMHAMHGENGQQGYAVFAERAWYDAGEMGYGFEYTGVSVHALPPPRPTGQMPATAESREVARMYAQTTGYDDYAFYAGTRHFDLFVGGVLAYGFPPRHKPADLDAVYKQYGHLESAFFQLSGPDQQPLDVQRHQHYAELASQRQTAAMTGQIAAGQQYGMAASQARSVERPDEDAAFNRVMQENPELANRYVAFTQQVNTLMQQGKFDEADALLDEIDALEQSNPELAALQNKDQARQASYQKQDQAHEDALQASTDDAMDNAYWGTSMEYLQAIDQDDYYTLIVIDNAFDPGAEKYSRDRALIALDTANRVHQPTSNWHISYPQDGEQTATSASEDEAAAEPEKESLGDKAKKAFNFLKKQ